MRLPASARTRRNITSSTAGAVWACSIGSSPRSQLRAASLLKKSSTQTYRAHQRGHELQAAGSLRRQGRSLIMLLSEGQIRDYRGVALMINACPKAKAFLADRCYDAACSATQWDRDASHPASNQRQTASCPSRTTPPSTASATRSRMCSANSKTGAASTPAMTDARTPCSPPSASSQP